MLTLEGQACYGMKNAKESNSAGVCVNSDGSDKQVPLII